MADSGFAAARLGFFICFILLIAAGAYAYKLRTDLTVARTTIATANQEQATIKAQLAKAEEAGKTDAGNLKACEQQQADLKNQLAQETAQATAAEQMHTRKRR